MKKLSFILSVVLISLSIISCSKDKHDGEGDSKSVRYVKSIMVEGDKYPCTYEYDSNNRLIKCTENAKTYTFTYAPDGKSANITVVGQTGEPVQSTMKFNDAGYTTEVKAIEPGFVLDMSYTYDANGYRTSEIPNEVNPRIINYEWVGGNMVKSKYVGENVEYDFVYTNIYNKPVNIDLNDISTAFYRPYFFSSGKQSTNLLAKVTPNTDSNPVVFTYEFDNDGYIVKIIRVHHIAGDPADIISSDTILITYY